MISIIVCSINKDARASFSERLEKTIGVEHELILIPNDIENLSICAAYNKGARAAKHPFLCFVHEDVTFHTPNWGAGLIENLRNMDTGFLGLAGATLKTRNPSPWWITHSDPLATSYCRAHYIQSGREQSQSYNTDRLLEEVLDLDGFFLACSRETWLQTGFDEMTFRGFHFYDMDVCMSAHMKGLKNYVYSGCRIEHHSTGSLNRGWINGAEAFQRKWQANLPAATGALPLQHLHALERMALTDYVNALIGNGYKWLSLKYLLVLLFRYKATPETRQVVKYWIRRSLQS